MKDFIKKHLREDLEYHYSGDATKDKYPLGEYDEYGDDEYDEFGDLDVIDEPMATPTKKISGVIPAYHGTTHRIDNFSDEFVGGAEANDQEGPGIYFTTDGQEAIKYGEDGGYVYKVNLKVNNLVSNEPNNDLDYLSTPIMKLIKMTPNWKQVARGYDDDLEEGLMEMVGRYIGMANSEKEAFIAVYNDAYKNNAVGFVRNMVKLGYDGVHLPTKSGGAHIVIYKSSLIKVTSAERIN